MNQRIRPRFLTHNIQSLKRRKRFLVVRRILLQILQVRENSSLLYPIITLDNPKEIAQSWSIKILKLKTINIILEKLNDRRRRMMAALAWPEEQQTFRFLTFVYLMVNNLHRKDWIQCFVTRNAVKTIDIDFNTYSRTFKV